MSARVGRDGFTGSPITVWCPTCGDWVVEHGKFCLWCENPVSSVRAALHARSSERQAAINERIRRMAAEGRSQRTIGAAVGMSHRTVGNRLMRMRAQLPTPGGS